MLLQRTPYGKHRERAVESATFFARHGYVVAFQDMRGRFASEGAFSKYHDFDVTDGYDTVEWLAKLPYTDGRVGMWGTSYGAHTQADAAKANPPSLGPLVLNQGGMSNAWDHAVRHGGAFELARELTWAFRYIPAETKDPVLKEAFERENVTDWYDALPLRPGSSPRLGPELRGLFPRIPTTTVSGSVQVSTGSSITTRPPTCRCSISADGSISSCAAPSKTMPSCRG